MFFSFSWILVSILPVSGFLVFLKPALVAERYLYIPSIGLALCAGALFGLLCKGAQAGVTDGWAHLLSRGLFILPAFILVYLSTVTFLHNYNRQDNQVYWSSVILDAPEHPLGYYWMGWHHSRQKESAESARMYQK